VERVRLFWEIALMVLLVLGVKVNRGPQVERDKTDQILKQAKIRDRERNVIQKLETHN
jgi:hypothetical protein